MRMPRFTFRDAPGVASAEFALVLPLFMLLIMAVLGLALYYFSLALTAAGVPLGARQAGVQNSAGAGAAVVQRVLGAAGPSGAVAGGAAVGLGASGCQRAVTVRLNGATGLKVPLLDALSVRLRAGSQTRYWRFWAGEPEDGCE